MPKSREERIIGFVKLDDDVELYFTDNQVKTEVFFGRRNAELIDIVLSYFDDGFLDFLIKSNVSVTTQNDLPPLFNNPSNKSQRRDLNLERRKLLLKYFATRCLIMHDGKPRLKENWPFNDKYKSLVMGRDNFQKNVKSHVN